MELVAVERARHYAKLGVKDKWERVMGIKTVAG